MSQSTGPLRALTEQLLAGHITRRTFLQRATALGVAASVAMSIASVVGPGAALRLATAAAQTPSASPATERWGRHGQRHPAPRGRHRGPGTRLRRRAEDHPVAGAVPAQRPPGRRRQGHPRRQPRARAADALRRGRRAAPEPRPGGPGLRQRPARRGPLQSHLQTPARRPLVRRRALHLRRCPLHLGMGDEPGQRLHLHRRLRAHRQHRDAGRPHRRGHLHEPEPALVRRLHRQRPGRGLPGACPGRRRGGGDGCVPPEAGRHRAVRGRGLLRQRPGDLCRERELPGTHETVLRARAAEGRRRGLGGGPRRAGNRRVPLRVVPAGGSGPAAHHGGGRRRQADRLPGRLCRAHAHQLLRPEHRGERPALREEHAAPVPDRPGGAAGDVDGDRPRADGERALPRRR